MSEAIRVTVEVDVDELREWAGRHADAGQHGVAHALYDAAERYESVEIARADAWDEGHSWGWSDAQEAQEAQEAYGLGQTMKRSEWHLCMRNPHRKDQQP